jgi:hypothetical protein
VASKKKNYSLSHLQASSLRSIAGNGLEQRNVGKVLQTTLGSLLYRGLVGLKDDKVLLTPHGRSVLSSYDTTGLAMRNTPGDPTDRVASLLRLARMRK